MPVQAAPHEGRAPESTEEARRGSRVLEQRGARPGRPTAVVREVLGRPEADDLHEPAPAWVEPRVEREVGEEEVSPGVDRLRLPDNRPVTSEASEVAGEPLLDAAVEAARFRRGEDRVAARERHE